jgi:hypothetical protein
VWSVGWFIVVWRAGLVAVVEVGAFRNRDIHGSWEEK